MSFEVPQTAPREERPSIRLLIVDEEEQVRNRLTRYLAQEGFAVAAVADGAAMDTWLAANPVDLVVLDLMLPGEDGLSVVRRLRQGSQVPIVMLSDRGDEVDRIVALEVGADDVLSKPCNPRELLARIRAVLRRQKCPKRAVTAVEDQHETGQDGKGQAGGPETGRHPGPALTFGPYRLDEERRQLTLGSEPVPLTSGEFDLLQVFMTRPNRVLGRDSLLDQLKGYERSPFDRSIDVLVARLRAKIESDTKHPIYIRTVWGKGYVFTPQGDV